MISKDRIVAAFDTIAPHIAILDSAGRIVHVNEAWRQFAVENDCPNPNAYVGLNYLDVVRRAVWTGDDLAYEALQGITAVVTGEQQRFSQEYPCHAPECERWFVMTVTRVSPGGDIVVAHNAVTPLVRAERESVAAQERLKRSLEAGLMGTFELDLDKGEIVLDSREAALLGLPPGSRRLSLAEFNRMLLPPDTTPIEARIAEAGERFSGELHLKLPDSSEHWLSFSAARKNHRASGSGRYVGLSFDVTERKEQEDQNRLFTREVRHGAKNLLAVVLAIARRTAGSKDQAVFAEEFSNRVAALSSTLDLLGNSDGRGVDIHDLAETHFEPFAEAREQVILAGSSVKVKAEAAQMLGMALHELVTNSLKYGALSSPDGRVSIEWSTALDQPEEEFSLTWTETGGPQVKPSEHKGFGYSVLMEQTAWALNAKVEVLYPSSGLIWKMAAPLQDIASDLPVH